MVPDAARHDHLKPFGTFADFGRVDTWTVAPTGGPSA
jgi:hypothetical protein